jgi:hypothetical protein
MNRYLPRPVRAHGDLPDNAFMNPAGMGKKYAVKHTFILTSPYSFLYPGISELLSGISKAGAE